MQVLRLRKPKYLTKDQELSRKYTERRENRRRHVLATLDAAAAVALGPRDMRPRLRKAGA